MLIKRIISRIVHASHSSGQIEKMLRNEYDMVVSSGFFDHEFYRKNNPDLIAYSGIDLVLHFILRGGVEGRSPSERFDSEWYLSRYVDVAQQRVNPLLHYLRHGRREGRLPCRGHLAKTFAATVRDDAILIAESGCFDRAFYLDTYPDIVGSALDPLEHFCRHGWREGRDPSPRFSTSYYLEKNPDVVAAGVNPLVHWLSHGRSEGRKIARKTVTPAVAPGPPSRPSVVFVSHEASRTGAPIVLLELLTWLRAHTDIEFSIVIGAHGPLDTAFEALGPTFYFADHPADAVREPLRAFCGNNVQVLYCNTVAASYYASQLAFLNAEMIFHVHELEGVFRHYEEAFLAIAPRCKTFIAVSEAVRECIAKRVDLQGREVLVLPPFIAPASEKSGAPSLRSRSPDETVIFGCGAVETRKGFDIFCDVAQRLRASGVRQVRMYWIGSDAHGDLDARAEIEERGVGNIVEWLGPQLNARAFFGQGDMFLLTSREDPFPLVCLEAAEAGLPVLCFDERAGGMHRFVEQDAGVVVPYLDRDAMASAVLDLVRDPQRRKSLGATASRKVRETHYVDQAAPRIAALFANVAASNAATEVDSFFEQIDRADLVSFDIFDTLVTRRIADPNTAFELIEFRHTQSEAGPLRLLTERMEAAGVALGSHDGRLDDVTIDQIYEHMAVFKEAEVEKAAELGLCVPHPVGLKLFRRAIEQGKPVFLASDMYLDEETVVRILEKCGYSGWSRLLLSSTVGLKKDTGRLYTRLITDAAALGVEAAHILHIGDNWESDVLRARSAGLRALRFTPLYEDRSAVVALDSARRERLSQIGQIWDSVCTQAFRLWIQDHPAIRSAFFTRLGFQVTGPLAAMFAMHVRRTADARGVKRILFLARDGRIVKDAFETLYREFLSRGEYRTDYVHLSRSTVVRATLRNPLSSSDLYFLMEGLHLGQKTLGYFLERAGLDPLSKAIAARVSEFGLSLDATPTWRDRATVANLLRSLSDAIHVANADARAALARYVEQLDLAEGDPVLLVDVGWLLNIQSRLTRFLEEMGSGARVIGCYFGSRDRIDKSLDHEAVLFRMGEPRHLSDLIEHNVTLFELLFSAPEAPAARLTEDETEQSARVVFKPLDSDSTEHLIAQHLHFGARSFFEVFAGCLRDFMPEAISRDYAGMLFDALVHSRSEEVLAAFGQVSVALGGSHDLESSVALIAGDPEFDYALGAAPERFSPVSFAATSQEPRSKIVVVTSAGLANGSTRYRALNLAETLREHGVDCAVMHSETDLSTFEAAMEEATAVVFQRCFEQQGNVGRFFGIARQHGRRCIAEMDDLVFPEFLEVIGSVAGGEWDLREAERVASSYDRFIARTDGCIVSTTALADHVRRRYGFDVARFTNRIGRAYLVPPTARDAARFRLAYSAGTRSHKRDFALVEPVVHDFVARNPAVEFHIVGAAQISERILGLRNVYCYPVLPYDEMMHVFRSMDAMIVPLEDNAFNDAKSHLKFVECGAVGVPVIASPAAEYAAVIRHEVNGWLARTADDWAAALKQAAGNSDRRRTVGRVAFECVRRDHSTASETDVPDVLRVLGMATADPR